MMAIAVFATPTIDGIYDGGLPVTQLFGLPLHPLLVQLSGVLLPLSAIGLILMASGIKRSKKYGGLIVLLAGVAAIATFLAMVSGRDMARGRNYGLQQHFELGGWLPWVGLAVFGGALLLWLVDKKPPKRSAFGALLAILSVVVASAAIIATVWIGYLGAQLTWGS